MSNVCAPPHGYDICPTQDQLRPQLMALWPRGRAWAEGGPGREPGGGLYGFTDALAALFAWVHAQICALGLEFFCQSQTLTTATWMEEYGLPDGCGPYQNLCAKVAADDSPQCAFYESVAAEYGYSVTCGWNCALDAGAFEAGMTPGNTFSPATLIVVIDVNNSPAIVTQFTTMGPVAGFLEPGMPACVVATSPVYMGNVPGVLEAGMSPICGDDPSQMYGLTYQFEKLYMGRVAGFMEAGAMPACGYDVATLDCVLERIVHADVQITYVFVDSAPDLPASYVS